MHIHQSVVSAVPIIHVHDADETLNGRIANEMTRLCGELSKFFIGAWDLRSVTLTAIERLSDEPHIIIAMIGQGEPRVQRG